jgi:hypothetical protein
LTAILQRDLRGLIREGIKVTMTLPPLLGHAAPYGVEIGHSAPRLGSVIVGVCRIGKIDKPNRPIAGGTTPRYHLGNQFLKSPIGTKSAMLH